MANVRITLMGTSPLLCHNVRLSDPGDAIAKEMKVINAKAKKTDDDRQALERLEWYGGLYTDSVIAGPVMPTASIRKCIIEAAKITKQGKNIVRALSFRDMVVPIVYDGPRDIDELFADPAYHNRAMVKVSMSRVPRVRPQFVRWTVEADAFLLTDVLDFDAFQRVVELAGQAEGLGDNRVNGYGRFVGEVKAA